jgi:hypothetical protein
MAIRRVGVFDDKESIMEANLSRKKMLDRNGILYPMLVIAAVWVILLSIFGVATITGLISTAQSNSVQRQDSRPKTQPQSVQPPAKTARATPTRIACAAWVGGRFHVASVRRVPPPHSYCSHRV